MKSPEEIKANCHQFIHGHYPVKPHNFLKKLGQRVDPEVESDFYGVGERLQSFESEIAELFGKEAAVFMISGTMAQPIALRIWSDRAKNNKVAFHPKCHLEIHEHKAYRHLHRLEAELIGEKDNLITLEDLVGMEEVPSSVLIELPQREIGGQLPSWKELEQQVSYLKSLDIKVHLDGARIWECQSFFQKSYKEIGELFDSIYISFYKGIGAVAGAMLLGNKDFVEESRIWMRRQGGNLIALYPYYLSAQYSFNLRINRFEEYFLKTLEMTEELKKYDIVKINPISPKVNMFHLYIKGNEKEIVRSVLAASAETGIWFFDKLQRTKKESFHHKEIYAGDAVLDIKKSDLKVYFKKVFEKLC